MPTETTGWRFTFVKWK